MIAKQLPASQELEKNMAIAFERQREGLYAEALSMFERLLVTAKVPTHIHASSFCLTHTQ